MPPLVVGFDIWAEHNVILGYSNPICNLVFIPDSCKFGMVSVESIRLKFLGYSSAITFWRWPAIMARFIKFAFFNIEPGYRHIHQGLPIPPVLINEPSFIKENNVFSTALSGVIIFLPEMSGLCKVLNKRIKDLPGLYLKPLFKFRSILAFIILLSGCVYSPKTDLLSHYNKILDQPFGNINRIKSEFEKNPAKSQQLGEELLRLIYTKHHDLGTEVSRLPDIRDGINPEEAKALDKLYKIVKPVYIPVDLANYKKALHRIKIEWTGEPGDWSAKIPYGINCPRHKIHNVKTIGFEKDDEIDSRLFNEKGFLMWYSRLDKGDSDGVLVEMDYPIHRPFVIEQIRKDGIAYSTIADLMLKKKMESVNLRGLNVTYIGERKSSDDIFVLTKEIIINEALIMGKGKRYSPALEALFWAIVDKKYSDKELNKYSDAFEMTKGFWGNMEGKRWQDYYTVIDRLSDKFLLFHYSANKIMYRYYNGWTQTAFNTFNKKTGNCYDQSIFNRAVFLRAGINTHLIRVHHVDGDHIILAFDQNDGTYVMDSGATSKLIGPFESWKKIPYDIIERKY